VYQKKSQLEHILLRPDTYVGSVEKQTASLWVHAAADGEAGPGAPPKLELRTIGYVPGLYKIFDEILVNAADNKVRDPSMTTLRVDLDAKSGSIRVYNDGDGIPVEIHKEEGVYVPELIFGHLLTSSNYDDTEKKVRHRCRRRRRSNARAQLTLLPPAARRRWAAATATAPSWPIYSARNSYWRRATASAGGAIAKCSGPICRSRSSP
jgi:hypothetical protein